MLARCTRLPQHQGRPCHHLLEKRILLLRLHLLLQPALCRGWPRLVKEVRATLQAPARPERRSQDEEGHRSQDEEGRRSKDEEAGPGPERRSQDEEGRRSQDRSLATCQQGCFARALQSS